MTAAGEVSALPAILTAVLLVGGAAITLIGSLGLLRLRGFYQRVHAPTLGTTLGTACIALASLVHFWALGTRPVLHELLIIVLVAVTTPISLMVLVRAALLRDESEGVSPPKPGTGESASSRPIGPAGVEPDVRRAENRFRSS